MQAFCCFDQMTGPLRGVLRIRLVFWGFHTVLRMIRNPIQLSLRGYARLALNPTTLRPKPLNLNQLKQAKPEPGNETGAS